MSRALAGRVAACATLLLAGSGTRTAIEVRPPRSTAEWRTIEPGMELGELTVRAAGEGRWTRVILLRLDPSEVRLKLQARLSAALDRGVWTVDSAPAGALAAFNAGQFSGIAPWGWTVMDGLEIRPPGVGPLSQAVVTDRSGAVRFVPPDSIETVRAAGGTVMAFQSYPSLLVGDGEIPAALTTRARAWGSAIGTRGWRCAGWATGGCCCCSPASTGWARWERASPSA